MSMMIIKMPQSKVEDLSEHIEKGLRYIGKAMQCIDEMKRMGGEMGERYGYGNRDWHVEDMGERDYRRYPMDMRYPDYDDMGERRGVRGTGRYSRFY